MSVLLVRDADGQYRPARADEVLKQARRVLSQRLRRGASLSSPQVVKDFLAVELGSLDHEVFCVLFLDAQHRVIALRPMFRGTVSKTSVYPGEVVKEALTQNAASVILAHNHPSGSTEPSRADEYLTQALKAALALVDVRVLDHLIVAGADAMSFAERGLILVEFGRRCGIVPTPFAQRSCATNELIAECRQVRLDSATC